MPSKVTPFEAISKINFYEYEASTLYYQNNVDTTEQKKVIFFRTFVNRLFLRFGYYNLLLVSRFIIPLQWFIVSNHSTENTMLKESLPSFVLQWTTIVCLVVLLPGHIAADNLLRLLIPSLIPMLQSLMGL